MALPHPQEKSAGTHEKAAKGSAPLADLAYQQIKRMLLVNELVAGQKLRYQDIASKLKVSQTPVIHALTRLENEGLVASEANKGFFVPELDLNEARELYEMRQTIECFLIGRTAALIKEGQIAQLQDLMAAHKKFRGEMYTRERLWCDAKFHLAIASFSGHATGERFLRQVFDRLVLRYRPERFSMARMSEAEQEHSQVFEALMAHNPDKAAEVMERHIKRGCEHIMEGLEQEAQFRKSFLPWD
ncbi:MAG: GntR family transcriptional regulator [Desulfarculaceae bacterium]|jgi:DNA-binding GntR family transcriptional regulator